MGVRLLVLTVLSVALMVVDARFTLLKPVRSQMSLVLMESYWITDLPQRLWQGVASQFGSRTELVAENEKLKTENLLLQGRMQKLAALTEQNVRLRELLNSSALVNEKVEVAELIGMDPNPFTHRIIINKGERDGVVLGQPVLDARGLMGQVVELMPYTSRVLLLTDTTHSIPVQVNRNGLRAIASGTGNPERLELRHVADTADIKEGDLLVSSGLGQRFPAGYPVATVKEVIHDSGQPFAIVRAVPTAALNRSRYLLLVFSDTRTPEERANEAAAAQEAQDRQGGESAARLPRRQFLPSYPSRKWLHRPRQLRPFQQRRQRQRPHPPRLLRNLPGRRLMRRRLSRPGPQPNHLSPRRPPRQPPGEHEKNEQYSIR